MRAERASETNPALSNRRLAPGAPGPRDVLTKIMVPAGGEEQWFGKDLVTPTSPAGYVAGSVSGDGLVLNANNEGGGTPPNTGLAWPAGRHRIAFDIDGDPATTVIFSAADNLVVVRNVTDSTFAASLAANPGVGPGRHTLVLEFDSVAGKLYQPQVKHANLPYTWTVHAIKHTFIPAAGQNETLRSDPLRNLVEKLGSDGGHFLTADVKGPVPFMIPPGLTAIFVVPLDAPKPGYNEPESVKGRTVVISATGSPRYYQ